MHAAGVRELTERVHREMISLFGGSTLLHRGATLRHQAATLRNDMYTIGATAILRAGIITRRRESTRGSYGDDPCQSGHNTDLLREHAGAVLEHMGIKPVSRVHRPQPGNTNSYKER